MLSGDTNTHGLSKEVAQVIRESLEEVGMHSVGMSLQTRGNKEAWSHQMWQSRKCGICRHERQGDRRLINAFSRILCPHFVENLKVFAA